MTLRIKTRQILSLLIAGLIASAFLVFIWQISGDELTADYVFADFSNHEMVAQGQKIYLEKCASCHGNQLQGQPNWETALPDGSMPAPPHDETGHTWHHPDSLTFDTIKFGGEILANDGRKNNMPAFSDVLSDDEIMATLAFIKSTWPKELQLFNVNICKSNA